MNEHLSTTVALNSLPDFGALEPAHAEPALDAVLAQNRAELKALLDQSEPPTWQSLVEPLEIMDARIGRVWGPVQHLFGVCSTAGWRAAYNACLPKLTEYGLELSQSIELYEAWRSLAESEHHATLSAEQKTVVAHALRDFRLSGVALPAEQKARYKTLSLRLSELQTQFEERLMDAVQAYGLHVTDADRLAGMPAGALQQAAAKARDKGLEGWWLTLDFPSFNAVVANADDRDLRATLYQAYATRASDQGPQAGEFDNAPLIEEILAIRHEQAQMLGFANFAELSLATKMAESAKAVDEFLVDLARRSRPLAQRELAELTAFARSLQGPETLEPWDTAYYSEKLMDQRFGLSDELLRPYFPLPSVLKGLFGLIHKLYGLDVLPIEGASVWHPDVSVHALVDANDREVGRFFLDPYARDEKRGGAWMDECLVRWRQGTDLQNPVAYLVCNFRPPVNAGEPALLTHDDVLTLFHEFGHGLHHLLTRVEAASVSGIRGVEWDAVELPSQFMENWCYEPATVQGFARHWQTGEALPTPMLEQLRLSRVFQAGMATVRQIEFALFDLRLHRDFDPNLGGRVAATLQQVRDQVSVLQPPAWNRMPCSFSHIFAGGYAAGYYSYKWAEVLSADVFAAFEESGFAAETGHRFRDTILANGGSKPAAELFEAFRGRAPNIDALLRHNGLVPAGEEDTAAAP